MTIYSILPPFTNIAAYIHVIPHVSADEDEMKKNLNSRGYVLHEFVTEPRDRKRSEEKRKQERDKYQEP